MRLIADYERQMVDGAAGVAVAGYLKLQEKYRGKKVAILLCGRNIPLHKYLAAITN